jgi:hypothetical protein
MSREWFDEFLDFLKIPPDSDLSPIALAHYRHYREMQRKKEPAFEDEEYSDLLRAKMIAVMESPLFLWGQVKGRKLPSTPQNPKYKTYEIIDLWPLLLSPEGFVEMISRTLLAVDMSNDTSYLKNIVCQELDLKIDSLLSEFSSTSRKDKMRRLKFDLESEKARRLEGIPTSFKPRDYPDWQEIIAIFFRHLVQGPNKKELGEIIFNFLDSLGYKANIETIRHKLKSL